MHSDAGGKVYRHSWRLSQCQGKTGDVAWRSLIEFQLLQSILLCHRVSVQSFQGRMIQIPAVSRFLQPGSKRKPQPDEKYKKTVMEVFKITGPLAP